MPTFDVREKSIEQLQVAQAAGQVSACDLVQAYLARIAAYDQQGPALNTIVCLSPLAMDRAAALDAERRSGCVRGPLHGIPILVKDNFQTFDMPTSAGSLVLKDFHPHRDACQVRRLREAGAIILGKTTMHELAIGVTNASSLSGYTRNPYAPARVPGGSSGGSGAAVAASFAAAAMGSDTAGSIRIPAANQGLVGLRVTPGLSSRAGVVPLSSTQDVAAPLARCASDLAIMLDATVGPDPDDASTMDASAHVVPRYRERLCTGVIPGLKVGVVRELFVQSPEDREVALVVRRMLDMLAGHGARVRDVSLPPLTPLMQDSNVIRHEFKFDFADYMTRHQGAPVRSLEEFFACGRHHPELDSVLRDRLAPRSRDSEEAHAAFAARRLLRQALLEVLQCDGLDVLAYPVMRRKAALIGHPQVGVNAQLSSGSGLPAIALPAGYTDDGVPVGIEFLTVPFAEQLLLNIAASCEALAPQRRSPNLDGITV